MSASDGDLETRIRDRAYQLWEQEGRPDGREEEFWLRAQADVTSGDGAVAEQAPQEPAGATEASSLPKAEMSRH